MAVTCWECSEVLLQAMGEETIRTTSGEILVFRRTTDYLLCPSCFSLYSVTRMREGDLAQRMTLEEAELSSHLSELSFTTEGTEEGSDE